jgi:hypothetical protein
MTVRFVFWDVQHGNATYISTPSGKHLVVDLGTGKLATGSVSFSPLRHLRNAWGVSHLDGVIITHPHKDHLDDIREFDGLSPGILSRPNHLTASEIRANNRGDLAVVNEYLRINERYNQPLGPEDNMFSSENNGGAKIQTFVPSSWRYNRKLWIEDSLKNVVYLPFEQSNGKPTLARRREGVHRCKAYTKTMKPVRGCYSISMRSPVRERGGC